jgi:cellulose synthase/poly-beta-1,6-N-acetylglucosamine synthase-like glycosyltransferase
MIIFFVMAVWNLVLIFFGSLAALFHVHSGFSDFLIENYSVLVIVPAHDEEDSVMDTVLSIWDAGCSAVVVADACTDHTVDILEHFDVPHIVVNKRNKGAALNYFLENSFLVYSGYQYLAVVDCGSLVDQNFGSRLIESLDHAAVVQSSLHSTGFLSWVNAWYSWNYGIYHLIALGRDLLHMPAFIGGSGWGWRVDMPVRFNEKCLVEDLELSLKIHKVGLPVVYRDLGVYDQKPSSFKSSFLQRLRWERGQWWLLFHGRFLTWRFDDFAQVMGAPSAILWSFFMIYGLIRAPLQVLPFLFLYWIYGVAGLIVMGDQKRVRLSTLITMPLMSIIEGYISLVALLSWKNTAWKRTAHLSGKNAAVET